MLYKPQRLGQDAQTSTSSVEGRAGSLLTLRRVEAGYGASQVLFGVDIDLSEHECITLIGRNGMGKSTTIKAIMGIVKATAGRILFEGKDLVGARPHVVARLGVGLVPEGRQIFPNLTVYENLIATASQRHKGESPWTLERVYELFPRLRERHYNFGGTLSGGEQQMLAIGRALMMNPRLLILDEATEGLAPLLRAEIWKCLNIIKRTGLALIVIDKNIGPLMELAERHYIFEKGRIVWAGSTQALRDDPNVVHEFIGI
jgi:branched-chain amino acid transport system ATP-binding protein